MREKKCIWVRRQHDHSRLPLSISGNPLWPLEELYDLRKRRFVAEPEFTPLTLDALRSKTEGASASSCDATQISTATLSRPFLRHSGFPIPGLVGGLPWRFRDQNGSPVVPEIELNGLDISALSRFGNTDF
jgi:hypothetical protein